MAASQKRILILDDDYESMEPLKNYLEMELDCYVVLTAEQGIIARLQTEVFDLLIVDQMIHRTGLNGDGIEVNNIQFEGVNWDQTGFEFYRRWHTGELLSGREGGTPASTPIFILSAVAGSFPSNDLPKGPFMEKPFRVEDIIRVIQEMLENKHENIS